MTEPVAEVAALLAAWRAVPDPRLAEALDALTARIARPAIGGATEKAKTAALLAIVGARDPLDQPRIAALIGTTRSPAMVEQLEILLEHCTEPDPRFSRPFVELLKHPPFHGSGTFPAWRRMFKLLQLHADPRLVDLLPALDMHALFVAHLPHTNPGELAYAAGFFQDRCGAVAAAIAKKHAKRATRMADAEVAPLVALAGQTSDAARSDELVAEVMANPNDAAAREVLADHLLETEDVRGRFIALQRAHTAGTLDAAGAAEEKTLFAAHALRWLGDLGAVAEHPHFVDGFLAWCELDTNKISTLDALAGNPLWSTLRGLHAGNFAFPRKLVAHPVMASLAQVTGVRADGATALLDGPDAFAWSRLGIDTPLAGADLAARLDRVVPRATALVVHAQSRPVRELAFLFGKGYERFTTIGISALAAARLRDTLAGMLEAARPGVALELCEYHHLGFLIRVSGDRQTLDLRARSTWGRRVAKLADLVDAVAPLGRGLQTVRLHDRATKADRARVQKLLAPGGAIVDLDGGPLD